MFLPEETTKAPSISLLIRMTWWTITSSTVMFLNSHRFLVFVGFQRLDEIALEDRRIGDGGDAAGRDVLFLLDVEVLLQVLLGQLKRHAVLIHQVKGEEFLVVGIDAVGGETAAQAVAAVVHEGNGFDDDVPFHQFPRLWR